MYIPLQNKTKNLQKSSNIALSALESGIGISSSDSGYSSKLLVSPAPLTLYKKKKKKNHNLNAR